ncbi:Rhamnose-binding lectin [Labeo rohita]|uniref:Rhamnose-binding lectin n=1 Tax=Labeo rohita TaxID=84645 RepID=A0ABQ8MEQ6_LABRO|nr:Rhamnose-binding lectin [Labeo rohita]
MELSGGSHINSMSDSTAPRENSNLAIPVSQTVTGVAVQQMFTRERARVISEETSDTGVISVQSTTYGRTSSLICSFDRTPSEISNTQCSVDVSAVSKRCNGLRECETNTPGLAPRDPCPDTYKYYTTEYICIPAETSVTCGGEFNFLECGYGKIQINTANYGRTDKFTCSEGRPSNDGTFIHIHSANYGRTDDSTCSAGRPASQLAKTDCYALNTETVVANVCEGKNSCSILASNSVFSDPCFGTFKYLYISYTCESKCKCYCTE